MIEKQVHKFSCSPIYQGEHVFYTLSMPSDVIVANALVSRRSENQTDGFQRYLDENRAQEIADYIDSGGTIPNSIILSAQEEAEVRIDRRKTFIFTSNSRSFLILDGQHRVYGFQKAKKVARVPVVIYVGLSLQDEVKLFIDLNTKQKPVPNELLLDIKSLANTESDLESKMRSAFDYFADETESPLYGLMSPSEKVTGKISRNTFNSAFKPIMKYFESRTPYSLYQIGSSFLSAVVFGFKGHEKEIEITKPIIFKAIINLFPRIADRVASRYDGNHQVDNYIEVMKPIFIGIKQSKISNPGQSPKVLSSELMSLIENSISI